MSDYLKVGYRLAVLLVLIFAAMSLTTTRASAKPYLTCQQICSNEERACFAACPPGEAGCREACIADWDDCIGAC